MIASTKPSAPEMEAIAARHPHLLQSSSNKRLKAALIGASLVSYMVFSWWFFSVGHVLANANWGIAGTYLADWISYEIRPDIEIAPDGTMVVSYQRNSPLGANPNPDWVVLEKETVTRTVETPAAAVQAPKPKASSSFSFMAPNAALGGNQGAGRQNAAQTRTEEVVTRALVTYDGSTNIEVAERLVKATHAGETFTMAVDGADTVTPQGPLPRWATQKRPGEKITLSFGLTGWAEVEGDEVSIRNRFFGWANFLFDTNSPFFGKSYGEVASLILSGDRIDPARSNLALAWNNILYNAEWQHLDVWTKLLQTVVMAFVGTLFASLIAFPLCFLAARNITPNLFANQLFKRFFDFLRSVDMFIWALFFTRAFGPGPLAGMSAIFFTDTGTLGKLYSEALENIDDKQREGVKSVGATPLAVQRFGVLPQVLPVFASQALYFWESNTRSATIIGAVGAGGIGLKLWEAMRTNSDWENVAYMVLLILMVVFVFDSISNVCRSRLMGRSAH
ncbi:phosphonate ABC transporter, permease protein PhnE [Sinorhizobium numidicum]|uniref:Phosphonate ABC transporter, permease protein PhnE n=1 Tax=Sinorhizobium numidicum TaxID=680248 RepID=A0ABY8CVM3_9HYPH|nr:phosphonate ABC transporter, permease protein PhnE [Sinorhizobium numidicum]WEX75313.1 phosphonate ABC transporter, permease protein PhnE [Sinorhizobium numidicum]WEX81308.1 phosphonate ABC transporter, permease protein PhnE [Sinorhizobium numidicum]